MKRRVYIVAAALILAVVPSIAAEAASKTYRLEQWIAPLECTQDEVVDGVNINTILSPEECDALLNPPEPEPEKPPIPGVPKPDVPKSPDTGARMNEAVSTGFVILLLVGSAVWTIWRAAIEQRELFARLRSRKR